MGPAFQIHLEPLQVSSPPDALEGSFHCDLHASFHTALLRVFSLHDNVSVKKPQLLCMAASISWILPDALGLIVHASPSSILQSSYTGTSRFFCLEFTLHQHYLYTSPYHLHPKHFAGKLTLSSGLSLVISY